MEEKELSNPLAIKKYFAMTTKEAAAEIRPLTKAERQELGDLCRQELGGGK